MRTSKDEYISKNGRKVLIGQDSEPPKGYTIYNGYDYEKQCWVSSGKKDVRTLSEVKSAVEMIKYYV